MKENRGRPKENIEKKLKFTVDYGDSRWYYDLSKHPYGPYLVEQLDTTYDKLEKLYYKLEKLKKPKYHDNGRKKRITKSDRKKMELVEKSYWKEHYRLFPNERPKRRGRKPNRR
tara:strand:- start:105 stop:446 length:342 start_codon:yes stop_codon:yes gene_type:complete